jgi:hypothetical protein
MMMKEATTWEKCVHCGKGIPFGRAYWLCSVSTCNKKSSPMRFCSVDCWEPHVSVLNHKNAYAEENKAPYQAATQSFASNTTTATSTTSAPREGRRIMAANPVAEKAHQQEAEGEADVLVVVSKVKKYVKDQCDFNVSANVSEKLSEIVRRELDKAILQCKKTERKTLMDRDFF